MKFEENDVVRIMTDCKGGVEKGAVGTSKMSALMFFFSGLCLWGLVAWEIGEANAMETIWVAREKIIDAAPTIPLEQVNVGRGMLFGIPVFVVGGIISAVLAELYYAALRHFRGESSNSLI